MADLIVVNSKVKEYAKKNGGTVAGDFPEAADKALKELVDKAVARAEANGRKTIMAKDI